MYCWNHQRQNIAQKADKLHLPRGDKQLVDQDVVRFLKHNSEATYLADKEETFQNSPHWNTPQGLRLQTYFNRYKDNKIINHCGTWKLREFGVEKPEMGLTNNPAETLNSQLAFMKGGRGKNMVSMDDATLKQYYWEKGLNHQVQAAYYGQGDFQLLDRYAHLARDPATMPASYCMTPEEMKMSMKKELEPKESDEHEFMPPVVSKELKGVSKLAQDIVERGTYKMVDIGDSQCCAIKVNKDNFMVDLTERTCSCRSTTICCHMLAAQVASGLKDDYSLPETKKSKATEGTKPVHFIPGRRSVHGTKKPTKRDLVSTAINPPSYVIKSVPPAPPISAGLPRFIYGEKPINLDTVPDFPGKLPTHTSLINGIIYKTCFLTSQKLCSNLTSILCIKFKFFFSINF